MSSLPTPLPVVLLLLLCWSGTATSAADSYSLSRDVDTTRLQKNSVSTTLPTITKTALATLPSSVLDLGLVLAGNLTDIVSYGSLIRVALSHKIPFVSYFGMNVNGSVAFVCKEVLEGTIMPFECHSPINASQVVVSVAATTVTDAGKSILMSFLVEVTAPEGTSNAAVAMAITRSEHVFHVRSTTVAIQESNTRRRNNARVVVVFEWVLVGVSMWFLAMATAVWMSWLKPVFRRGVIWKWSAIFFILINAISWGLGLIGWMTVVTFFVTLSLVANFLYCCRKRRQLNFEVGVIDKALPWNSIPRKLTRHQKLSLLKALVCFFCLIVAFSILFSTWHVADYQLWSRQSQSNIVEYQPQIIAKSSAAIYAFDGFAARLSLATVFDWSHLCAKRFNTKLSDDEKLIDIKEAFIDKYSIDMSEYQRPDFREYTTVNDWFSRKILPSKRPIAGLSKDAVIVSPADARIIAMEQVPIDSKLWLKNDELTVQELLGDDPFYSHLAEGSAFVVRLAPQDYHRYHSPVSGTIVSQHKIDGPLFSVSADAMRSGNRAIYNKRTVTVLRMASGEYVGFVAIGATCVGSVVSTVELGDTVTKGDELGYFQFGGSTVVSIFPKGKIEISDDLVGQSDSAVETLVQQGMQIGIWN